MVVFKERCSLSMALLVTAMLLLDESGRFLLAQRQKPPSLAGMWEFPGGKMRPRESPEVCLTREIWEELGCEVDVVGIHDANFHVYDDTGEVLILCYRCRLLSGSPRGMEGQGCRWFHPSEIPGLDIAPADVPIVLRLLASARGLAVE